MIYKMINNDILQMEDKMIERYDLYCIIKYNNVQAKITFPTNDYNFYLVGPYEDTDYEWYDNLNIYCIEKKPTEEKILTKLYKYIDKQNIKGIRKYSTTQIDTNEKLKSIDTYDMSHYRMKEKIKAFAETSIFLENEFAQNVNIKSIYNENILVNILIEEYLNCWENKINVELLNNNIFSWKVKLEKFDESFSNELNRLYEMCGIKHVELNIYFHGKLYPNYPPIVRITSPQFMNQLSHRISNSKMTQLSYWTPSRSVKYIIDRVTHLINKWGKLDFGENQTKTVYSPTLIELDCNLQKLSSFIDPVKQDDEIDLDEEFISFNMINIKKSSSTTTTTSKNGKGWKAGTGYGTHGSINWDPKEFIKMQAEKDANITMILGKIINALYSCNEYLQMSEIISKSLLISYLKQQFTGISLLDVKTRLPVYKLCFSIISELLHEETMNLFNIRYENSSDTLYDVLIKLHDILKTTQSIKLGEDNNDKSELDYLEFELMMANTIEVILIPMFESYSTTLEKNKLNNLLIQNTITDARSKYTELMSKFVFKYADIINTNFKPDFKTLYENALKNGTNFNNCRKRLRVELPMFKISGSLPIDFDSSIFVRIDESNPMIIRALITGPKDTPYDSGCMIFDIYTSETYPVNCPNVKFMNHGGKRFNPNLYHCGKVCLSILGQSYIGPTPSASEKWNETSNLLQVLISIQSQILIEDPYFNEPGHESSMGTTSGNSCTKSYNENIRTYMMKSTMLDLLENPLLYPQFEDVIINHFKLKRDYISQVLDKWTSEATTTKSVCVQLSEKIKKLLDKL